jgi:hypothetical protein
MDKRTRNNLLSTSQRKYDDMVMRKGGDLIAEFLVSEEIPDVFGI